MAFVHVVPSTISYIEFAEQYLKKNRPCLIDQELTASWKARKLWQEGGKPSLEYLKKEFGKIFLNFALLINSISLIYYYCGSIAYFL